MLSPQPMAMGSIQGKRIANLNRKRSQKQRRNLRSTGSYLVTQEGIHCKGHLKGDSPRGNSMADLVPQEVAPQPVGPPQVLVAPLEPSLLDYLECSPGRDRQRNKTGHAGKAKMVDAARRRQTHPSHESETATGCRSPPSRLLWSCRRC